MTTQPGTWIVLFILIVFTAVLMFGPTLSEWSRERRKRNHSGWFDPDCPACQRRLDDDIEEGNRS